ncbi:MAG: hypothetical protein HDS59_07145 [Barnesiella sp.]|nr:hypothetical protein [Barnesiella sp.]
MKQLESEQTKSKPTKNYSLSTGSPHFWWLICILMFVIIALISFIISERVCCSENLMNYISVCSVLLSITLSIFAIQYTYTSNNEIHRQFDKINSVADNIKATSENLAATNTLLKENLDKIQDTLDSFDISQKQIVSQIKDFTTNRDINITDIPQNNRKQVDK